MTSFKEHQKQKAFERASSYGDDEIEKLYIDASQDMFEAVEEVQEQLINTIHSLLEDIEFFIIGAGEDPTEFESIGKARALINKINGDTDEEK
jgi:hypothetical protein